MRSDEPRSREIRTVTDCFPSFLFSGGVAADFFSEMSPKTVNGRGNIENQRRIHTRVAALCLIVESGAPSNVWDIRFRDDERVLRSVDHPVYIYIQRKTAAPRRSIKK